MPFTAFYDDDREPAALKDQKCGKQSE